VYGQASPAVDVGAVVRPCWRSVCVEPAVEHRWDGDREPEKKNAVVVIAVLELVAVAVVGGTGIVDTGLRPGIDTFAAA
jgi:hypothetical protein